MNINYLPPKTILINGIVIEFNEARNLIRKKLGEKYLEDNQVIQLGESPEDIIYQRRDIYESLSSVEDYFFLGYNKNDLLSEVEVHCCEKIMVNDFSFDFNDELTSITAGLNEYSSEKRLAGNEYFFKEIKVVVMDKNQMGGEGSTLGYFYCAEDVTHLEG